VFAAGGQCEDCADAEPLASSPADQYEIGGSLAALRALAGSIGGIGPRFRTAMKIPPRLTTFLLQVRLPVVDTSNFDQFSACAQRSSLFI
jgi:hypothetical protein